MKVNGLPCLEEIRETTGAYWGQGEVTETCEGAVTPADPGLWAWPAPSLVQNPGLLPGWLT